MSVRRETEVSKIGRTAVGRVPPGDYGRSTNIWERWQITEDLVSLGQQAAGPVRTCDRRKRLCAVIVGGVPRDARSANDERSGEESDDGDELHVCDCKEARVLFA